MNTSNSIAKKNKGSNFSLYAARISFVATAMFLAILAIVHVIKPEISPSWRDISEYEIGNDGWLMQLAFFFLATGCASLIVAVQSQTRTIKGYIGLALLLVAAVGLVVAGIFITDPVTVSRANWSTSGALHAWGAVMIIPGAPIIATLITWALSRRSAIWIASGRILWLATGAIWLSLVTFVIAGGTQFDGTQGSGDWYGWPNRTFIVAFSVWIMIVARNAAKVHRTRKSE